MEPPHHAHVCTRRWLWGHRRRRTSMPSLLAGETRGHGRKGPLGEELGMVRIIKMLAWLVAAILILIVGARVYFADLIEGP